MKKITFTFEFEEEKANRLTYEVSREENEKLESSVENGVPFIYMNRSAMVTIAKILIKMANGSYNNDFHLHLHRDFDEDAPDALVLMPSSDSSSGNNSL